MIEHDKQSGITMVELLISISIFVFIAAIVIYGFVDSRKHSDLRLAADSLVSNIRQMQSYAITGRQVNGATPNGFGLSINMGDQAGYTLYADDRYYSQTSGNCLIGAGQMPNQRYDGFIAVSNCLEDLVDAGEIVLPGSVKIDKIYLNNDLMTNTIVDLNFVVPEGTLHARFGKEEEYFDRANTSYQTQQPLNVNVEICLLQTNINLYRKITILGSSGQINVGSTVSSCP
ncbi:MAG: type II secretion system protein [Patescibacteria group bacterium]